MSNQLALQMLAKRGVTLDDISEIVYKLQKPYNDFLTKEECAESVLAVLNKREVQYTLFTGIALDELAERRLLPQPLQAIMENDESLYGVDETLALGIVHVYGMIGLTSFGYLDKEKMGIILDLNNHSSSIHVFLDDLVAGLAAAASARIAHQNKNVMDYTITDTVTDAVKGKETVSDKVMDMAADESGGSPDDGNMPQTMAAENDANERNED